MSRATYLAWKAAILWVLAVIAAVLTFMNASLSLTGLLVVVVGAIITILLWWNGYRNWDARKLCWATLADSSINDRKVLAIQVGKGCGPRLHPEPIRIIKLHYRPNSPQQSFAVESDGWGIGMRRCACKLQDLQGNLRAYPCMVT